MPALSFRRCTVASQQRIADKVAGLSMMTVLLRTFCHIPVMVCAFEAEFVVCCLPSVCAYRATISFRQKTKISPSRCYAILATKG